MRQVEWYSTRLSFTVVNVHTIADEQRSDRTMTPRWSLGRLGFGLLALAFPLLATGKGRALLAGVLPRHLRHAVRPRGLANGQSSQPSLPAGPG
jgi:hypothetical protein